MTDLPKYEGNWSRCDKCGLCTDTRCQYVAATPETQTLMHAVVPQNHLELTCRNCGYRWAVACADMVEQP